MANPDAFIGFAAVCGGFFGFFVLLMACAMPETFFQPVKLFCLGVKFLTK